MHRAPDGADPPAPVLIVEDHELLATSLALALRQQGLQVDTIDGGGGRQEIVDMVRRLAPALVLLDLDLGPALGEGADLIRPLIEAGGTVVIMTGVVDRVRLAACVESGAAGIVSKTAGFGILVDAVRRAVDGEELISVRERQDLLSELRIWRQAERDRWAPFERLSPREQAVLEGLLAGDPAETIALHSYVSLATVRSQIRAILLKLGVTSQLAAVALTRSAGWPGASGNSSIVGMGGRPMQPNTH